MDIGFKNTYPSNALSNFAPHPFELDGVQTASMEAFLQYNGHKDIVKLLIKNGVDIHHEDEICLRVAAFFGHIDVVRILLKNGANVRKVIDDTSVLTYMREPLQKKLEK